MPIVVDYSKNDIPPDNTICACACGLVIDPSMSSKGTRYHLDHCIIVPKCCHCKKRLDKDMPHYCANDGTP